MAQAQRGIDCRQAGPVLFDAAFISATTGLAVTTGTATCQLFEVESDGTLKPFDFSTNTFLANNGVPTTATISLTSQGTGTGPTLTGYWSAVLSTTTGLTAGGIYLITYSVPSGAAAYAMRKIQWGLAEGDVSVNSAGNVAVDLQTIKTQAITCAAGVTVLASVGTATASTAQTGDSFARIGATGSGLSTLATAASLATLTTTVGTAGAGLTALGDTRIANLDATVSSRATATALASLVTTVGSAGAGLTSVGDTAGTTTLLSRVTGAVALASQIPANFTTATFASAGVFSTGALANAPTGGGSFPTNFAAMVIDTSGRVTLAPAGLDAITVETGVNARQALSPILAAAGGQVSGAGTGTIVLKAGANPSTTRITATTDSSGNRSAVMFNLPT